MPEPRRPKPTPKPPTYADIVRELKAEGQYQDPMAVRVMPTEHPGYMYEAPDPLRQAARLAERQEAVRKLASPVSPVLEVPEDVARQRAKMSWLDQLIAAWRNRQ